LNGPSATISVWVSSGSHRETVATCDDKLDSRCGAYAWAEPANVAAKVIVSAPARIRSRLIGLSFRMPNGPA
jgi:hypothetical protein